MCIRRSSRVLPFQRTLSSARPSKWTTVRPTLEVLGPVKREGPAIRFLRRGGICFTAAFTFSCQGSFAVTASFALAPLLVTSSPPHSFPFWVKHFVVRCWPLVAGCVTKRILGLAFLSFGVGALAVFLCIVTRTWDIDMPPWHADICCPRRQNLPTLMRQEVRHLRPCEEASLSSLMVRTPRHTGVLFSFCVP